MGVIGRGFNVIKEWFTGRVRDAENAQIEDRANSAVENAQEASDKVSIAASNAAGQLGQIEALYNQHSKEAAEWERKGKLAASKGEMELAKTAAANYAAAKARADKLKPRIDSLREQVQGFGAKAKDVQSQVNDARAQAAEIIARNGVADAEKEFHDAVSGAGGTSAGTGQSLNELEQKVAGKEGSNKMRGELNGSSDAEKFAKLEREAATNDILAQWGVASAAPAPAAPAPPPAQNVNGEEWNITA
ncbi:MAG: PspA/IM30 family protein [Candidatus Eremiobacterota bacterium]